MTEEEDSRTISKWFDIPPAEREFSRSQGPDEMGFFL
jgi:hypothetical protein